MNKNGQTGLVIVIAILFLVAVAFLNIFKIPPQFPVIFLLASTIFVISFINTDAALVILIFSMLLSPELPVGGIRGRVVVLRIDDVFLFVVFLGWLAKMAVNKELLDLLVCPKCKGDINLEEDGSGLVCNPCKLLYPIEDDIPVMLIDEARDLSASSGG